jgi:uncharacterized protein (TIGR03435 family)
MEKLVSVKPNRTGSGSSINGLIRGNRFISTNVTVGQLVRSAHHIQDFQIAGQPGWFDTEKLLSEP